MEPIKETYISKARRNARAKELKALGLTVKLRSYGPCQLHPQYLQDAAAEGITYQTGFGNTDYTRLWDKIYIVESV